MIYRTLFIRSNVFMINFLPTLRVFVKFIQVFIRFNVTHKSDGIHESSFIDIHIVTFDPTFYFFLPPRSFGRRLMTLPDAKL